MSLNENDDIKQRPEIWDNAVVGLAALLTLAALGACIFLFTIPAPKPRAQAPSNQALAPANQAPAPTNQAPAPPNEVTVGIFPAKPAH